MPGWLRWTSLSTLFTFLTLVMPAGRALAEPPPPPSAAAATSASDAELAEAKAHYQAGKAAYDATDYPTAIREWKAAQTLKPSPKLDYNIGVAYERMNRPRAALKYFRRYLEAVPSAQNRAEVEQKIPVLEAQARTQKAPETDPGAQPATPPPPPPPSGGQTLQGQGQGQGQGEPAPPGYGQPPPLPGYGPGQAQYGQRPVAGYPQQPAVPQKKKSYWWIVFPIVGGVLLTVLIIYAVSSVGSSSTTTTYGASSPLTTSPGLPPASSPLEGPPLFRF